MSTATLNIEKKKRLVPKLRFPEFEGEWKVDELGNNAKVTSGGTPSRNKNNFWNGNIPWITTSLINFNVINTAEEFITQDAVLKSSAKLFPKGTILMAMYGQGKTRGKVAVLGLDATTNQACSAILPNDDLDKNYLFQNFAGRYEEIRDLSNEGGQQNLSGGIIKGIKISFPTLPEQQKIASFLSAVDEKIQQLSRKKELLSQYKKGVMQQLFSGKLRFKPAPPAGGDENGNDYADWEKKKLGDIGIFQTSSIDKLSKDNEQEVYLVNYMNVYRHEEINNNTVKHFQVVTAKENQINSCNLKKGDILFTPSSETPSDIGHSVVIFEDIENAVYSYHLMRFRPKRKIDILYSHYFCNIPEVLNQLSKLATGSTRFTISVKSFSSIEVKLPCIEEQQKIANFLSSIDAKIESCSQQINQTQNFKKGLLQQLFV